MSLRKWILLSVLFSTLVGCGGPWSSGDRVLVSKCAYDTGISGPHRYDVVVFKYPKQPVKNNTPTNYIKRLLGLPGELLAIFFGRVYRWVPEPDEQPPFNDSDVDPLVLHEAQYMHTNEDPAHFWFGEGYDKATKKERYFEILRKPPHVMLAMRRTVFDNDYQAKDLKGKLDRWAPDAKSGWKNDSETGFGHDGSAGEMVDWLHYKHLVRPANNAPITGHLKERQPRLITDTMDYNSLQTQHMDRTPSYQYWVGDLMIEANVEVVEPKGEFWYELNKGIYRFRACWELSSGECTLYRVDMAGNSEELGRVPTRVKGPGSYMLRFANIDARLAVWVDRELPFGDGKEYDPPEMPKKGEKITREQLEARSGPTENDLKPASVGSKGASVKVTHIRLWRDTYYTTSTNRESDYRLPVDMRNPEQFRDEKLWEPLRKLRYSTMYVQPGHYLCLGDNSQASSDSRDWGTVPERLMLGRALMIYFPLERIGPIR